MPTYDYRCPCCDKRFEWIVPISERGAQRCPQCDTLLEQLLAAPLFRIQGQITPGGGPDKFTADMLGIPLKELPAGLRSDAGDAKP